VAARAVAIIVPGRGLGNCPLADMLASGDHVRVSDGRSEGGEGPEVFRIAIPASRIDASREFYETVLGVAVDATVPSRLYFHCGDVIVALIAWSIEGRGELHPVPDNLSFATGEPDDLFERAVKAGARVTSGIDERPWGERPFSCLDPDGNRLCFVDRSTLFLRRGAAWR
jgi:catechol 2,3-dioxygenase-like lactoylglutathione lyase family enzyme